MMTQPTTHPLVQDYLVRLALESRVLPPDQAHELLADITEHISSGLAEGATEADVRNLLERLGTPAEVIASAAPPGVHTVPAPPSPPVRAVPRPGLGQPGVLEMGAIAALVVAEVFVVAGWFMPQLLWPAMVLGRPLAALAWIVGLVLLPISGSWTWREKLRALVIFGSGAPLATAIQDIVLGSWPGCFDGPGAGRFGGDSVWQAQCGGASPWLLVLLFVAAGLYAAVQVRTAQGLLQVRSADGDGRQAG